MSNGMHQKSLITYILNSTEHSSPPHLKRSHILLYKEIDGVDFFHITDMEHLMPQETSASNLNSRGIYDPQTLENPFYFFHHYNPFRFKGHISWLTGQININVSNMEVNLENHK